MKKENILDSMLTHCLLLSLRLLHQHYIKLIVLYFMHCKNIHLNKAFSLLACPKV